MKSLDMAFGDDYHKFILTHGNLDELDGYYHECKKAIAGWESMDHIMQAQAILSSVVSKPHIDSVLAFIHSYEYVIEQNSRLNQP